MPERPAQAFAGKEADLDDGATDVERVLRRGAAAAKGALAGLLRHMDEKRQRADARLADGLAASSPAAAAELRKLQSGKLRSQGLEGHSLDTVNKGKACPEWYASCCATPLSHTYSRTPPMF